MSEININTHCQSVNNCKSQCIYEMINSATYVSANFSRDVWLFINKIRTGTKIETWSLSKNKSSVECRLCVLSNDN